MVKKEANRFRLPILNAGTNPFLTAIYSTTLYVAVTGVKLKETREARRFWRPTCKKGAARANIKRPQETMGILAQQNAFERVAWLKSVVRVFGINLTTKLAISRHQSKRQNKSSNVVGKPLQSSVGCDSRDQKNLYER